jgi:hypothetical protein
MVGHGLSKVIPEMSASTEDAPRIISRIAGTDIFAIPPILYDKT